MRGVDLNPTDLEQIERHGIPRQEVERQLRLLRRSPNPLRLDRPCKIGDGIVRLPEEDHPALLALAEEAARTGRLLKFVPASGAATRMFKTLRRFLAEDAPALADLQEKAEAGDDEARHLTEFVERLGELPFFDELADSLRRSGLEIAECRARGAYRPILRHLLLPEALGYDETPKGLIPFHRYPDGGRTAFQEHLAEAPLYLADAGGRCCLHFTVSPEHLEAFEEHLGKVRSRHEDGASLEVELSVQSPATDTVAVDLEGRPFRSEDGSLLLRPGGHGALIGNLGRLDADVVLIKNIDNVVPERSQGDIARWKLLLTGYLAALQREVFEHLERLAETPGDPDALRAAMRFAREKLWLEAPDDLDGTDRRLGYLLERLDRPLRVCGVVPNRDEPGGGPFWVRDTEGGLSLQIVESAQVDPTSREQQAIWSSATHFNPVDLACGMRDRRGSPFDLERFVDPEAVFIARKSLGGRPLKALEHPGLWNGAMAGWNTTFVEVPAETFAPVKTVLDLLRPAHRTEAAP